MSKEKIPEASKPVKSADEAAARAEELKKATEAKAEKIVVIKAVERADSDKMLITKLHIEHNGVVYEKGAQVPDKLAGLFIDKGFAELV